MIDRETLRRALRLYAITPDSLRGTAEVLAATVVATRAGVTAVQYRCKRPGVTAAEHRDAASAVVRGCRQGGALSIINDDPRLALEADADAVHLGPHDGDVAAVRRAVGDRLVIGASAGTIERAVALVQAGADYLGVGAIYDASGTKPNASPPRGVGVLTQLRTHPVLRDVPIVAIGGITPANADACIGAGADGVAVVRAIMGQRDIASAVRGFW